MRTIQAPSLFFSPEVKKKEGKDLLTKIPWLKFSRAADLMKVPPVKVTSSPGPTMGYDEILLAISSDAYLTYNIFP